MLASGMRLLYRAGRIRTASADGMQILHFRDNEKGSGLES
jgi:hypothetical protein